MPQCWCEERGQSSWFGLYYRAEAVLRFQFDYINYTYWVSGRHFHVYEVFWYLPLPSFRPLLFLLLPFFYLTTLPCTFMSPLSLPSSLPLLSKWGNDQIYLIRVFIEAWVRGYLQKHGWLDWWLQINGSPSRSNCEPPVHPQGGWGLIPE